MTQRDCSEESLKMDQSVRESKMVVIISLPSGGIEHCVGDSRRDGKSRATTVMKESGYCSLLFDGKIKNSVEEI